MRSGFKSDQANPRTELWYFTFRSLMVRILISSRYSTIHILLPLHAAPGLDEPSDLGVICSAHDILSLSQHLCRALQSIYLRFKDNPALAAQSIVGNQCQIPGYDKRQRGDQKPRGKILNHIPDYIPVAVIDGKIRSGARCSAVMVEDLCLRHVDAIPACQACPEGQIHILHVEKEILIEKADLIQHLLSVEGSSCAGPKDLLLGIVLPIDPARTFLDPRPRRFERGKFPQN